MKEFYADADKALTGSKVCGYSHLNVNLTAAGGRKSKHDGLSNPLDSFYGPIEVPGPTPEKFSGIQWFISRNVKDCQAEPWIRKAKA